MAKVASRNLELDMSQTVFRSACLHWLALMKSLRFSTSTMMVSASQLHFFEIISLLFIGRAVCSVPDAQGEKNQGYSISSKWLCLHHQPFHASQPAIQFLTVRRWNLKIQKGTKLPLGSKDPHQMFQPFYKPIQRMHKRD